MEGNSPVMTLEETVKSTEGKIPAVKIEIYPHFSTENLSAKNPLDNLLKEGET